MTPHEAAQSLWWFVVIVMLGVAIVLLIDYSKEKEEAKSEDYVFDPSRHSSKFYPPRSLKIADALTKEKKDE